MRTAGFVYREQQPGTVLAATWDAVASGITTSGLPMRVSAAPFRRGGRDKAATVAITVEVTGSLQPWRTIFFVIGALDILVLAIGGVWVAWNMEELQ